MRSIFHIKNQKWKYSGHRKLLCELLKLSKLNAFILLEHWCIYSCLQIPPREDWFQYVRRVYATAINFPCIITLFLLINLRVLLFHTIQISDLRRFLSPLTQWFLSPSTQWFNLRHLTFLSELPIVWVRFVHLFSHGINICQNLRKAIC